MSYLMAAFLWCVMALMVGMCGVACLLAGVWALGAGFLAFACIAGLISYSLGKDPA